VQKFSRSSLISSVDKKLRVYVGKTENHRGTTRLFTSTFLRLAEKATRKQRDRSQLIWGLTYINEVSEKRNWSWIDSVYQSIRS